MASNAKIFKITVPLKDGLCCAICKVNNENTPLVYSQFCMNKLKCRQFLREMPRAMAAPITNRRILEAGGSMYVIVVKEFFDSSFQDHCDELNVQVMDLVDPIPTYVYKACLLHTVEYRLAPQWNKVGLYLVEGRDFLSSTGNVNAIKLDIRDITGNSARLYVEPINIKIPFVRLNARPLPHDMMQPPVRVLPSMKMAHVIYISKTITEKFEDYEQLREYWKDMHGYVLPDYKDGHLFYNIEFFYFKSNKFLYPDTCLASGPLTVLPLPVDPVPLIYKFVEELRRRVSKLCDQQLDICIENTYQAAVLSCTPTLPRPHKLSVPCDSGYGTRREGVCGNTTSSFRIPDTCEIPTKRVRLSLSRTNDPLMNEPDVFDFNYGINPPCSMNKFSRLKNASGTSVIPFDINDACLAGTPAVRKDDSKSYYFKETKEEERSLELKDNKEDKSKKLSLKEKLLRINE